jgi:hypothetical protein
MMTASENGQETEDSGSALAMRVRVTQGPDPNVIGKIGYLFDFDHHEYQSYIVTVTESEVRRLHLQDGYEYELAEF